MHVCKETMSLPAIGYVTDRSHVKTSRISLTVYVVPLGLVSRISSPATRFGKS